MEPLAHEAALHVREGDDDGIDGAVASALLEVLKSEHGPGSLTPES
jgi:hypothetical protein